MTTDLVLAARRIPDPSDLVRRYCGLPWSGGPPEVWAFRYYDVRPDDDPSDVVTPVDVLRAAALHAG